MEVRIVLATLAFLVVVNAWTAFRYWTDGATGMAWSAIVLGALALLAIGGVAIVHSRLRAEPTPQWIWMVWAVQAVGIGIGFWVIVGFAMAPAMSWPYTLLAYSGPSLAYLAVRWVMDEYRREFELAHGVVRAGDEYAGSMEDAPPRRSWLRRRLNL
jgi:hypothetical protein